MSEKQQGQLNMAPIGVLDSGLGGLSVLREAIRILPGEDFIYYGDSLHAPYGTKSVEEIRDLTFCAAEYLLQKQVKALVVACNTATAAAIGELRETYPDMVIVGIEPAIRPAVLEGEGGEILMLATPMTITQDKYHHLLEKYEDQAVIRSVPCDGLMEFVESGVLSGPELDRYLEEHLKPYLNEKTETLVLGCTHYPFLKDGMLSYLERNGYGKRVKILDGSLGTVKELRRRLAVKGLLSGKESGGEVTLCNSLPGEEILERSRMILMG